MGNDIQISVNFVKVLHKTKNSIKNKINVLICVMIYGIINRFE